MIGFQGFGYRAYELSLFELSITLHHEGKEFFVFEGTAGKSGKEKSGERN